MARRKDRELFEILKQSRKRRQQLDDDWQQRQQVQQSQPEVATPPPAPSMDVPHPDTRPTITLRQDTCVLGLIGLILLLIITAIAAYYKGGNDARISGTLGLDLAEELSEDKNDNASSTPIRRTPKKPVKKKTPPPTKKAGKKAKPSKGVWALRIWTGSKRATVSARELLSFMRARGFDAWTKTDKEGIKVFVGGFKSSSEPMAVKTRNQVRKLVYKGSRSFEDCYFVREK